MTSPEVAGQPMHGHYATVRMRIERDRSFVDQARKNGIAMPGSLERAVLKRQCEFVAGRQCAIEAMRKLGLPSPAQPARGAHGEPLWPRGITGSISHHSGLAVAVATRAPLLGIGIDVERWVEAGTAEKIFPTVLPHGEHKEKPSWLTFPAFLTAVYSAKESLFKAVFPRIGRYVDFSAARYAGFSGMATMWLSLRQTLNESLVKGMLIPTRIVWRANDVETLVILE